MRLTADIPENIYVYRRVPPDHWHVVDGIERPKLEAFDDAKDHDLSVFLADEQSPRGALQHAIDNAQSRNNNNWLNKHGRTVEELLAAPYAWRVARVPLSVLEQAGLHKSTGEVGRGGHITLPGFLQRDRMKDLIAKAEIMPLDICLESDPVLPIRIDK